ncbi:MAG: hypothetical protein V3W41_14275 [Planctomycetota bacterium]
MNRYIPLALASLLLASVVANAQFERTVAITGSANSGLSFVLKITSTALTRTIEFGPLETDFSEAAVAALMIEGINDNYSLNGKTGFQARALKKPDTKEKISNGFVVLATSMITEIAIGPSGGTTTAPRAPGVAFNPTFSDFQSDDPTPFLGIQPQNPNARLFLSGHNMIAPGDPTEDFFREVEVPMTMAAGGDLGLVMNSGVNAFANIALLVGPFRPNGDGVYHAPWGDFLEIGIAQPFPALPTGNAFLFDGIFAGGPFSTDGNGNFSVSNVNFPFATIAAQQAAGVPHDGFQGLFVDPTMPPLNLAFSAAVVPIYGAGRVRQIPLPTNGSVTIDFLPNMVFEFYGQTYTEVTAYENGLLTFGPNLVAGGAVAVDPVAVSTSPIPAVFVNWADYDLVGSTGAVGMLRIYEFENEIRITWGEPGVSSLSHANDIDNAQLEVTLTLQDPMLAPPPAAGTIRMDFLLDATANEGNDGVVGISPGLLTAMPVNVDLGLSRFAAGLNEPLLQQATTNSFPTSSLNVVSGGVAAYSNGSGWNRRSITFYPPTFSGLGPAMDRYHSVPERSRPDDFAGVVGAAVGGNQLSNSAPALQSLALIGYFQFVFDTLGAPQVTIELVDPTGTFFANPFPLTPSALAVGPDQADLIPSAVTTIPIPSGFRDFEVLQVSAMAPLTVVAVPAGGVPLDLAVTFPGFAAPIIIPNAVTLVP